MGERLLKLHVDPSIVRGMAPELPHGGRPLQYPRLTSCVLSSSGLDLTLLLPYAVVRQLQRLDAGLPLELPILPTHVGAGHLADPSSCSISGPRDLRSSSTSAFSPVSPGASGAASPTPLPDSTTLEHDLSVFGLSLQDMVGLDEAADEEVRKAMADLVEQGTAQPLFSPDLMCHESSLSLNPDRDLPFPQPSVICDVCGHSGYTSTSCPRCHMEHMCDVLNGEWSDGAISQLVLGWVCLPGSDSVR